MSPRSSSIAWCWVGFMACTVPAFSALAQTPAASAAATAPAPAAPVAKKKLSYKEQKELEQLPATIEALEVEQKMLNEQLADGSLYASDGIKATAMMTRVAAIEEELLLALERWEALSA
mgnify:CR=1 FL=1